jgi:BlaI family penicillinase repressor
MGGNESHLEKIPRLATDIIHTLSSSSKWSPSTIKTLLNRLISKGALRFKKAGKSYLYSAAHSEEECRAAEANSFLDRVFDGALLSMISHFIRSRRLTQNELASLKRVLQEKKEPNEAYFL